MKKIKKILMNNLKLLIGIIIGTVVSGVTVYAATLVASSEVSYTLNGQTTVKGALDDLYTKAQNSGIDSNSIDFATIKTNTAKTVLASSKGVCIYRNNKLNCFKSDNWNYEKDHIKQVFSDISCSENPYCVDCVASDFYCTGYSNGNVHCYDQSDDSGCDAFYSGTVNCY